METLLAHPLPADKTPKKTSFKIGVQRVPGKPLRVFTILYKKSPSAVVPTETR